MSFVAVCWILARSLRDSCSVIASPLQRFLHLFRFCELEQSHSKGWERIALVKDYMCFLKQKSVSCWKQCAKENAILNWEHPGKGWESMSSQPARKIRTTTSQKACKRPASNPQFAKRNNRTSQRPTRINQKVSKLLWMCCVLSNILVDLLHVCESSLSDRLLGFAIFCWIHCGINRGNIRQNNSVRQALNSWPWSHLTSTGKTNKYKRTWTKINIQIHTHACKQTIPQINTTLRECTQINKPHKAWTFGFVCMFVFPTNLPLFVDLLARSTLNEPCVVVHKLWVPHNVPLTCVQDPIYKEMQTITMFSFVYCWLFVFDFRYLNFYVFMYFSSGLSFYVRGHWRLTPH